MLSCSWGRTAPVTGVASTRGKAIAFSAGGYECSTAEGDGETFAELRRCARWHYIRTFNEFVTQFTIHIDGRRLRHPREWTFTSANRVVDFPRNNLFGAPAGPTRSSTRGLLHVLKPPTPGEHVVRLHVDDWEFGKDTFVFRFTVGR